MIKTYCTVHVIARRKDGKILLLRRAKGRSSPGKWNCITGYIQERESGENVAIRELYEETGLRGKLIKTAVPYWKDKGEIRFVIIASLIDVKSIHRLKIDPVESQDFRWVEVTNKLIDPDYSMMTSLKLLGLVD